MSSRIVSSSTVVEASPSTVFSILADPRQHQRIDGSGSLQGVVTGPDRLSRGAEFGMSMKIGAPYKIKNRVVEFEEDRLIAWRHQGAHRWRYELEPADGGATRVTESWDASRYPLPAWLVLKAARFPQRNRRGIEGTLVKLAEAAEADEKATKEQA